VARSSLSEAVEAAVRDVPARRHIQSIVVSLDGELVFERYFRDRRPTDLSNVHSVTKSLLATLVGIALGDGSLTLETTLGEHFDVEGRKARISVEQLLTMTSGLDAGSPHDIDEIADRGESWVAGPLATPLLAEPGDAFVYNNGAAHVLGVLVARATGMPLARFAEERLFALLGIAEYRWPADPEGNALGHGHLELRPRELVRLGELYLEGGQELLPPSFVAAATTAHSAGGPPEGVPYGYLWWIAEDAGYPSFFAGGYGGQYVTVVPELALVVVTTGDAAVLIETSRNLRRLVAEVVVPALAPG
jgi:CubicO group peptidase (beta-lactamase class C family)